MFTLLTVIITQGFLFSTFLCTHVLQKLKLFQYLSGSSFVCVEGLLQYFQVHFRRTFGCAKSVSVRSNIENRKYSVTNWSTISSEKKAHQNFFQAYQDMMLTISIAISEFSITIYLLRNVYVTYRDYNRDTLILHFCGNSCSAQIGAFVIFFRVDHYICRMFAAVVLGASRMNSWFG